MSEQIDITVEWSPALVRRAAAVHSGITRSSMVEFVIGLGFLAFGMFLAILYSVLYEAEKDGYTDGVVQGIFGSVVGFYIAFRLYSSLTGWLRRKRNRASTFHSEPWNLRLAETGIEVQSQTYSANYDWSCVSSVRQMRGGIVLGLGPQFFQPVPDNGLPNGITRKHLITSIEQWRQKRR